MQGARHHLVLSGEFLIKGFLFHPIFIHFPIAFYFLELVLRIFYRVKRDEAYRRFASFSFRIGYLGMLLAVLTGTIDAGGVFNMTSAVRTHFLAVTGVFTLYTLRALLERFVKPVHPSYDLIQMFGALLGNLAIAVAAFFGGRLVYS